MKAMMKMARTNITVIINIIECYFYCSISTLVINNATNVITTVVF